MKRPANERIPRGIMIRMIRNFQSPDLSEGLDSVKVLGTGMTG
ncbi:MAG: hypothetical protein WCE81_11780 [Halobacteriota archaeon]